MSKPKVVGVFNSTSGVHYHRIYAPLAYMAKRDMIDLHLTKQPIDVKPDVTHFVASRWFPFKPEYLEQAVRACKLQGTRMILDLDDWWHVPKTNSAWQGYENSISIVDHNGNEVKRKGLRWLIERSIMAADEVWVTNKQLAKKVRPLNRNVRIYPNGIDMSEAQWIDQYKEPSEALRFGYIAGKTHEHDLIESGIDLTGFEGYAANVSTYKELIKAKYTLDTKSPNDYGQLYKSIDVSLIPLEPSEFAKCKSFLKMLEAGFTNTACIVRDVLPYSPLITDKNCVRIRNNSEWMPAIKSMTKQKAADLAGQLRIDVQLYEMSNLIRELNA